MNFQGIDTLIAAAIGALAAIFVGAFITLLFICRRQKKRKNWDRLDNRSVKRNGKKRSEPELSIVLGDIGLTSALEQILNDQQWVDDASGLIPHCLALLHACHSLTERLANFAMTPDIKNSTDRLIEAAKRIPSRVDDVVQAMYPPLDPRLLEARTSNLVLAVGQMALLTQTTVGTNKSWIYQSLQEMDHHLLVLRKALLEIDEPKRIDFIKNNLFV